MKPNKEAEVKALLSLLRDPIPPTALTAILHRDIDREGVIAGIKPKVAKHLRDAVAQLGLSEQIAADVLFCFVQLVALEDLGKSCIKTANDRRADLEQTATLCDALSKVLRSFDHREAIALNLLGKKALRPWADPDAQRNPVLPGFLNIEELGGAARWLREQIPKVSGGPRPLLKAYAMEVARLWAAVEPSGLIKLGRGGDFEDLCNQLFKAARVDAEAEGAIRYFKRNLLGKAAHEIPMIADLLVQANGRPTFPSFSRRKKPENK